MKSAPSCVAINLELIPITSVIYISVLGKVALKIDDVHYVAFGSGTLSAYLIDKHEIVRISILINGGIDASK